MDSLTNLTYARPKQQPLAVTARPLPATSTAGGEARQHKRRRRPSSTNETSVSKLTHGNERVSYEPHVNSVWPSLDAVPYARYTCPRAQSACIRVAHPRRVDNPASSSELESWPAEMLLQTRVMEQQHDPSLHCTHYYQRGRCLLGESCHFVHAVRLADAERNRCWTPVNARAHGSPPTIMHSTDADGSGDKRLHTPDASMGIDKKKTTEDRTRWWYHDPYAAGGRTCV